MEVDNMEVKVIMPRLGSEMEHGNIVEWLKKVGEPVKKGEALFSVDTEKAVMEVESEVNGVLKKIMVSDKDQQVPVGDVVAVIETKP
jgi:pyruvate/2-oxoglutarate dehydrogenase complex dihydrolipoamide acyltransferase (E2) component